MSEIDLTDPDAVNETLKAKDRAIAALTREVAGLRERHEILAYVYQCACNFILTPPGRLQGDYRRELVKAIDEVARHNIATQWGKSPRALAATTDTKETTDGNNP